MIIFTKFHEDRTKNMDFLLMANFWTCLIFFIQILTYKTKEKHVDTHRILVSFRAVRTRVAGMAAAILISERFTNAYNTNIWDMFAKMYYYLPHQYFRASDSPVSSILQLPQKILNGHIELSPALKIYWWTFCTTFKLVRFILSKTLYPGERRLWRSASRFHRGIL